MSDRLRVDIDGGKYTVVMTQEGHLSALRYGEPWRECVGDNLIGHMAHEIEELREHRTSLLAACEAMLAHNWNDNTAMAVAAREMAIAAVAKAKP